MSDFPGFEYVGVIDSAIRQREDVRSYRVRSVSYIHTRSVVSSSRSLEALRIALRSVISKDGRSRRDSNTFIKKGDCQLDPEHCQGFETINTIHGELHPF